MNTKQLCDQLTEKSVRRTLRDMGMFVRKRTENGEAVYTIVNSAERPIYGGKNLSLQDVRNFAADEYAARRKALS